MSIRKKIKYGIVRSIIGNDEALLYFQENGEGGGFIQIDDDTDNSGLRGVGKCLMENCQDMHDFILGLAEDYLKDHTDERLEFSKRIYENTTNN